MNSYFFKITLAAIFLLISIGNFALLSKYNIYVGDDGYLASYLYEYHFTGSRSFVLCSNWAIHQFLVGTLGPVYRGLYDLHLSFLEAVGAEYHYINGLSALLFLLTLTMFIATLVRIKRRWLVLIGLIIFGTLEPFLVMSHSIRTESVILFALAVGTYSLTRSRADFITVSGLFFSASIILNTHLGGWPLLVGLGAGVWYIFGGRSLMLYLIGAIVGLAIYLLLNDLFSFNALTELANKYREQGSVSTYTRFHVLNDIYAYYVHAKYKRHLIELIIIAAFITVSTYWQKLSRSVRGVILCTVSSFIAYIILFSYINSYYLVYFYYLMLVSAVLAGNEILSDQWSKYLVLPIIAPFVLLYTALFFTFIKSPGWDEMIKKRELILSHLPKGVLVAAPEYFVNLDPRQHRSFIPLAQAVNPGCIAGYDGVRDLDVIISDTRQREIIVSHLGDFNLVNQIKIGRLATQSISDLGELFIYTRIK